MKDIEQYTVDNAREIISYRTIAQHISWCEPTAHTTTKNANFVSLLNGHLEVALEVVVIP